MGLFTKHCALCGRKIEKGQDTVKYGYHFDSEAHAETYAKEIEDQKTTHKDSGHQGHVCC